MSHIIRRNATGHTHEFVMSHIKKSHVTRMAKYCLKRRERSQNSVAWVISQVINESQFIWSDISHTWNEACHNFEEGMSHAIVSHVTTVWSTSKDPTKSKQTICICAALPIHMRVYLLSESKSMGRYVVCSWTRNVKNLHELCNTSIVRVKDPRPANKTCVWVVGHIFSANVRHDSFMGIEHLS